jgi:hypothetical protein
MGIRIRAAGGWGGRSPDREMIPEGAYGGELIGEEGSWT